MEVLFLIFPISLIVLTLIICIRELRLNHFNPIPKFDDKIEKSINTIEFVKCRCIEKF